MKSEIVVPGTGTAGIADVYPAVVSDDVPADEVVTDVDLTVGSVNHTFADDIDMVLQGPGGETVNVLSDVCGNVDLHHKSWEFNDEASAPLSDNDSTGCAAGTVQPSNFGTVGDDTLPAPAPQGAYGDELSAFDGLPGGQWRLFVRDDGNGDTGFIDDWSVDVDSRGGSTVSFPQFLSEVKEGETATVEVKRSTEYGLGPATMNVDAERIEGDGDDITVPASISFARDETTRTIEVPVADDAGEEPMERILLTLSGAQGDARILSTRHEIRIAPSDKVLPSNELTFGKAKKLRWGGVRLPVGFPGAGPVEATGPMIKKHYATSFGDEKANLYLEPNKQARLQFQQGTKVTTTVDVTFTPYEGVAATKQTTVVLRKKPKKH